MMKNYLIRIVTMSIAVGMAGCGGGTPNGPAQPVLAPAEPQSVMLATATFIERAQNESCADSSNRLFLIDQKQVFWDRSGACPDNAYERRLLGKTPDTVLCSLGDSIGGPRQACADESARPLFDTILKNLDKPDLGLGAGHKVEAVPFLPKGATAMAFTSIAHDSNSGVGTAQTLVVRDGIAWTRLWAEHHRNRTPAPPLPQVDFSKSMVIALFLGARGNGCYGIDVTRLYRRAGVINVDHTDAVPGPDSICTMSLTAPSQMVLVEQSADPVQFNPRIPVSVPFLPEGATALPFQSIVHANSSGVRERKTAVIKDAEAWAKLWTEHQTGSIAGKLATTAPNASLPKVDFSKSMVLTMFKGSIASACDQTDVTSVFRKNNTIFVLDDGPNAGINAPCAIHDPSMGPVDMVVVERSEDPVEFIVQAWMVID